MMSDLSLVLLGTIEGSSEDFSKIAKPIREVITGLENQSKRTAKKTFVEWTEAADSAFEHLKKLCTSTPILGIPRLSSCHLFYIQIVALKV